MQHAITVGDVIEWVVNGAVTTIFTVVIVLVLKTLIENRNDQDKGK